MKAQFVPLIAIGVGFLSSCGQPSSKGPPPSPVPTTKLGTPQEQRTGRDNRNDEISKERQVATLSQRDTLSSALDATLPVEVRLSAWTCVDEEHRRSINHLITALKNPPTDRSDASLFPAVIIRLGELRVPTAAAPLIDWLTYHPQGYEGGRGTGGPESHYMLFPAAMALANIGRPAIPELLDVIEHAKTKSFDREVACWVLWYMETNPSADSSQWQIERKMATDRVLLRLKHFRQLRELAEGELQNEVIGDKHEKMRGINEAIEFVENDNFDLHNWEETDIKSFVSRGTGEFSRSELEQQVRIKGVGQDQRGRD